MHGSDVTPWWSLGDVDLKYMYGIPSFHLKIIFVTSIMVNSSLHNFPHVWHAISFELFSSMCLQILLWHLCFILLLCFLFVFFFFVADNYFWIKIQNALILLFIILLFIIITVIWFQYRPVQLETLNQGKFTTHKTFPIL